MMAVDEKLTSSSLTSYHANKSNRVCLTPMDHISVLPIELRYHIMVRMPLQDAAKMSLLSKAWLYTWESFPILCFGKDFHDHINLRNFSVFECLSILYKVVICHTGPICGIYLCYPDMKLDDSGPLLSLLSSKNIKQIFLGNDNVDIAAASPKLSSQLFSCLELEKLFIRGWNLYIPPSFEGFKNLVSLSLKRIIVTGKSFNDVIASCPLLESLTLKQCEGLGSINIVAPNLKYFEVSGKFESLFFSNAPSLLDLSITSIMINNHEFRPLELPTNLKRLAVEGSFLKLMAADLNARMLPRYFDSLKVLELESIETNDLSEFRGVLGMIESCSSVELIIISFSSKSSVEHNITTFDADYKFSVLRKVQVTCVLGFYMELKLIEFLLLCSPALEELCVKTSTLIHPNLESKLFSELMNFQRASPKARVTCLH